MSLRLLIVVFMVLIGVQDASAAKRIALVIGNGQYEQLAELPKALNDARALRETLTADLGFEVIYGENLSRRDTNRRLSELESRIERDDLVFIYFAGHGVSLSGENYLLPADLQQPEVGEDDLVKSDSTAASAMVAKISAKKPSAIYVVLDACRKNPFDKASIGQGVGLSKTAFPDGVFVLYPASLGKASLDSLSETDQNPNSLFVRNLLPLLKTPYLTQAELALRVQQQVSSTAAAAGLEQIPAFENKIENPLSLIEGAGETVTQPDPPVATTPTPGPTPDATASTTILEEWKLVRDSGNRAALEGFKKKYGSDPVWGPLVDQALAKLDGAGKSSSPPADVSTELSEDLENRPLYRDLQAELRRVQCYSGPLDGVWGASSQRALNEFARVNELSLLPDGNALDELSIEGVKSCRLEKVREAEAPAPKVVQRKAVPKATSKPAKVVVKPKTRSRPTLPARVCWVCHTYTYATERVCVPRRDGNPSMRIPHLIRCRRG